MNLHRLIIRILIFPLLSLLAFETTFARQGSQETPRNKRREASSELRNKLFQQLLDDYAELRDCLKTEEGGIGAARDSMTAEEVDLNGDGIPEFELQLTGTCSCGAHNCSIWVYRGAGQTYESILDGSGLGLEVLKTSSNGYADLRINAHDTAATESRTRYKFDGKQYREFNTTVVNLETGESKPAQRRIVFKPGTSATTVQGKATLALPDTYLIGARAGQVMTVQLSAPRKAVTFLVMSPSSRALLADNARSWTGKLPESGDYYIIVGSDERAGTYSMSVGIR